MAMRWVFLGNEMGHECKVKCEIDKIHKQVFVTDWIYLIFN